MSEARKDDAPKTDWAAVFEKARAADIVAVAGTPLFKAGRRMRGECPLCGASKGKRADGAFSAEPSLRVFTCWACGQNGDVIELDRLLRGGTTREAAERLAGGVIAAVSVKRTPYRPEPVDDGRFQAATANRLWREARGADDSPVAAYLRGRGIGGEPLRLALERLRFHPKAHHHSERGRPVCAPAMIAIVHTPAGPTGGVHATYLTPGGEAKAALEPAKRMWGPQTRDGLRGGVWLTPIGAPGPLVEGEGIESTLSAQILLARPCRAVAALSLNGMQGGWARDRYGRVNPDAPASDPERLAFTWPEPEGAPWGEVILAVDRDMAPLKVKARKACGGTWKRQLTADERARVCAALAEQAWRRAGATSVRVIGPGAGRDFNDELRARA